MWIIESITISKWGSEIFILFYFFIYKGDQIMSQVFSDFQILQTHLQQCCENENMCFNFHEKEYMAKYYKNVKHKGKGKKKPKGHIYHMPLIFLLQP